MSKESRQGKNPPDAIQLLWREGFFKTQQNLPAVAGELGGRGNNFSSVNLSKALSSARFLSRRGKRGAYAYLQKISAISREVESIEHELFSEGTKGSGTFI